MHARYTPTVHGLPAGESKLQPCRRRRLLRGLRRLRGLPIVSHCQSCWGTRADAAVADDHHRRQTQATLAPEAKAAWTHIKRGDLTRRDRAMGHPLVGSSYTIAVRIQAASRSGRLKLTSRVTCQRPSSKTKSMLSSICIFGPPTGIFREIRTWPRSPFTVAL